MKLVYGNILLKFALHQPMQIPYQNNFNQCAKSKSLLAPYSAGKGQQFQQKKKKKKKKKVFVVNKIEPTNEIMARIALLKLILQTRMRSHPMGLDV